MTPMLLFTHNSIVTFIDFVGFFFTDLTIYQRLVQRLQGVWMSRAIYFNHEIKNAGLGLACLYMTVLGFDQITTSFAYSQGVPEHVLGTIGSLGSAFGLLGSIAFPFMVGRLGVLRTGS